MIDAFGFPFMQRAAAEIMILAPLAGLLGAQIVLRGLAIQAHGIGAATFPGLVLAGPAGLPPSLCALAAGLGFTGISSSASGRRIPRDAVVALLIVAFIAAGVILASDVFESGAEVDRLLFGSLLAIGDRELTVAGIVTTATALAAWFGRRAWIAAAFDGDGGQTRAGRHERIAEALLALVIVAGVIAALDAVGALLVSAILVLPAATAQRLASSVSRLELYAIAIAAIEGVTGLWLAFELDAPPGATIATLAGIVFALVLIAGRLGSGRVRSEIGGTRP